MKKVKIYCRVSAEKQNNGYSLSQQKEKLKKYCEKKDYNIVSYIVEYCSGKNWECIDLKQIQKH